MAATCGWLSQNAAFGGQDCLAVVEDGLWDDRHCDEPLPGLCVSDVLLCVNGVLDVGNGETGVDCGGNCAPCSVSVEYTSSNGANMSTTHVHPIQITATFSSLAAGVTEADFGLVVSGPGSVGGYSTTLTAVDGYPSTRWVLSVSLSSLDGAYVSTSAWGPNQGSIVPPTEAMSGGFVLDYAPPVPSYSVGGLSSGDTVSAPVTEFTVTFTSAVSGVAVSDFQLDLSGLAASTSVSPVGGSEPATQYVLRVEVLDRPATATSISVGVMGERSGSISPVNAAGVGGGFTLEYAPPVPTLSSSEGVNGTRVAGPVHTITASFTTAVSNLTAAQMGFSVGSSGVGVSTSVAAVGGGVTSTSWVLTITLVAPLVDADLTVSLLRDQVVPANVEATNTPFVLHYVAPPCEVDPCGIGIGRAASCVNVDDLAGTFECACSTGYFGDLCTEACPEGTQLASLLPPRCVRLTPNTTWPEDGNCTAGESFATIHSVTESVWYWNTCSSVQPRRCWGAASDSATEGVWQWQDSSPWDFENWKGVNPDDVSAAAAELNSLC